MPYTRSRIYSTHARSALYCDSRTFECQWSTPTVPMSTTNTHHFRPPSGASLGVWGEPPRKDGRVEAAAVVEKDAELPWGTRTMHSEPVHIHTMLSLQALR